MIVPPEPLPNATFLILAMACAGMLHLAWFRTQVAQRWDWPLDCGFHFRGRRVFGDNKKVRGFLVMPLAAAVSFSAWSLQAAHAPDWFSTGLWPATTQNYALLGFSCGFAFMLAELPNSFLKRQLNVEPGQAPTAPGLRLFCAILDRYDSVLGVLAIASVLVPVPLMTWLWSLLIGPSVHAFFSLLQFKLGLKGRAL